MSKCKAGKIMSFILASAMLCQSTAMAAPTPAEELDEILERQSERAEESLLEQRLGFSEIGDEAEDKGLEFALQCRLLPGTEEILGIEDEIPKGGYVTLHTQVDPKEKQWLFEAGVGSEEVSLLDLSLYGDVEQLALSVPQFFAGALALKAGNFREQYLASDLAQILGQTEDIPDFDMSFYPEEASDDFLFEELGEKLEEKGEELEESMVVEKSQEGDVTVYTSSLATKDIMDIYRLIFEEYLSLFTENELLLAASDDFDTLEEDLDAMISQMEAIMGDEVSVRFDVKDDLVERISYEMYLDTSALSDVETEWTEIVEETLAPSGNAENGSNPATEAPAQGNSGEANPEETATEADEIARLAEEIAASDEADGNLTATDDDFRGYLTYELVFKNPENPGQGFDVNVLFEDSDRQELGTMKMEFSSQKEGSVKESTFSLDFVMGGETLYSDTPFRMTYDTETDDLDAEIRFADTETEEEVVIALDSSFSDVEKGKGFTWKVDALSVTVDGETVGVSGEVSVSAAPERIAAPASVRTILELTQEELLGLVNEITSNAEAWSYLIDPQEETEVLYDEEPLENVEDIA